MRPAKPCDYCRSKHLECYLRDDCTGCTSCTSLFRECSLSNSQTLEASNYNNDSNGAFFDTLHSVDELSCRERGTLTGIKTLHSRGSGTLTPRGDDAPGSSKRNGIRFPRHAVKALREWLDSHQHHPYPTEEEKAELERQTELKPIQIANWLANARRRAKTNQRSRPKLCESPSLRPCTPAIDIPEPEKPWEELNPFERWQHSPPENEPARFTDIFKAVERSDLPEEATSPSSYNTRRHKNSSNGSGWSQKRAQSTTSFDTSQPSSISHSAVSSAANSRGSSHGSYGSFSSSLAGKKDRRRRRRNVATHARQPTEDKRRIFQCTFCTDTFKSKYDWTRHEKSLHLSLEKWICAPIGPVIVDKETGKKTCVYCKEQDVSAEHGESHNHSACEEKGFDARTFYRKDHLRQHLRLMHGCEMLPCMDAWKSVATNINSRCGFCAQRFSVWQERVDHLTAHFKAGAKMSQWKGCRGLDPAVAAQVTNAMPPYLIGIEAVSPNPFSATSRNHCNAHATEVVARAEAQEGPRDRTVGGNDAEQNQTTMATCWEILTVRLGKYANDMAAKGIVLTDEMLQSYARKVLYGSDDSWNQTAADNPEWLDLFKKAHGLDFIPSAVGGEGSQIPEDLETYGDLGLRIPFSVQLAAFNQAQAKQHGNLKMSPGPDKQVIQQKREEVRSLYHQLAKEGVLHGPDYRCQHAECEGNVADMRPFEKSPGTEPKTRRWCSYELPISALKRPVQGSPGMQANSGTHTPVFDPNLQQRFSAGSDSIEQQLLDFNAGVVNEEWISEDPVVAAAQSRWEMLERLQKGEVANCPFTEQNERLGALRDRQQATSRADAIARGLDTLTAMEAAEEDDNWGPNGIPLRGPQTPADNSTSTSPYLRRHKYELPPHRAQRFATVTPAWKESGLMPPPTFTASTPNPSLPSIANADSTSTGAMMEFLGPNVGAGLDFASDAATRQIPLQPQGQGQGQQPLTAEYTLLHGNHTEDATAHDWFNGTDWGADESVLLKDLDDLIASSGAGFAGVDGMNVAAEPPGLDLNAAPQQNWSTEALVPGGLGAAGGGEDVAMEDVGFDDLNFDSVFDFEGHAGQ